MGRAAGVGITHPIARHGFLSDGHSAALVSPDGNITWWCAPRFDAPPACDALLGGARRISLRFQDARVTHFAYEPDTLVLTTRWEGDDFAARVHDFMPYPAKGTTIVRVIRVERGVARLIIEEGAPWPLVGSSDERAFVVGPGATRALSFDEAERALDDTIEAWRGWAARCTYAGPRRDLVVRSLLTLKALEYSPTGAIIAAPTTSLPEVIGGERNWDYRYAWLRDTGFCMDAFVSSGYDAEAQSLADWVLSTVQQTPGKDLRVMYDIRGGPAPAEARVDLPGYRASRPVRLGNDAVDQFQLDAYGHVMDCLHLWQKFGHPESRKLWPHVRELIERCRHVWRDPDHGIWELPNGRRQLTYSKVMAWVALDRALKAAKRHQLDAPVDEWERTRDEIRDVILREGVDAATGAFTQAFGESAADASNLRLSLVGFLPPDDPRILATIAQTQRELMREGLLLRYANEDGLAGDEGAFLACSFWLVEALAMAGRHTEAEELFLRLTSLAGPLGLFAEEVDPGTGAHLGNYPQAFTHAALVSAAWQLVDPASTRTRGEKTGARKKHDAKR